MPGRAVVVAAEPRPAGRRARRADRTPDPGLGRRLRCPGQPDAARLRPHPCLSAFCGAAPSAGWTTTACLVRERSLPDGTRKRARFAAALDASAHGRLDHLRPEAGLGFDIRFHLHPDIQARLDGDRVHLSLPGGEAWTFEHDRVGRLALEPSCLLDRTSAEPRPSQQIVVSGRLHGRAIQIGWTLARSGVR
ncbi:heparinase II/III domain-containing protein [Paracoccus mutanolyticus]|uniref:heparinase II/III domain-containing protein n=1 Tax=Paracoccus mutanolyticus TaxID=1499308 RepID=UPI00295005C8|nr:heparinase II/III family protein [Paracoccus mutanolyticus]